MNVDSFRLENVFQGMCLSLRATGSLNLNIHGPRGCMDIYEATKSFVTFEDFDIDGFTEDDHVYDDHAISVSHVKLEAESKAVVAPEPIYCTWDPGK
jgi:hypothetical protein